MEWGYIIGGAGLALTLLGLILRVAGDASRTKTTVDQHDERLERLEQEKALSDREHAAFRERVAREYVPHTALDRLEERMVRGFADLKAELLNAVKLIINRE